MACKAAGDMMIANKTGMKNKIIGTVSFGGNAAAFLCSDLASGITGEITYVDAGFNMMGMSERLLNE